MKQLFFVALLTLIVVPAYAEWVAVGTTVEDETMYVDLETIYREGDLVDISVISDFKAAKHLQDGSRYRSARLLHQYNCVEERFRLLAVTLFAEVGTWRPIPSDSVGPQLVELVCPT